MTKQEMYLSIRQDDERLQKNKTKRILKLYFGSSTIFFIASLIWFKNDIITSLVLALVSGGLYFFSGLLLWVPFINANNRENTQLEERKKEYKQTYNEIWY